MKQLLMIIGIVALSLSCAKRTGNGNITITVTNLEGVPIQNCNVKLTYPGSPESAWGVDYFLSTTDINGQVTFKSPLNAYFDVYTWKGIWEGCDFVEFEPGVIKDKKVIIYPPGTAFNGCF
jgi:hypothetical protein